MGRAKNFGTVRMTLREMLGQVACCALACVSLKFASTTFWVVVASIGMLLFMAAAIMAFVDRGPRQAFAIGVVICAATYGGFVFGVGGDLNPYSGRLPSSKLMLPIYRAVVRDKWEDPFTGETMPGTAFDPSYPRRAYWPNNNIMQSGRTRMSDEPNPTTFMYIAHAWWAALFAYFGGRFAAWVYARRANASEVAGSSKDAGA